MFSIAMDLYCLHSILPIQIFIILFALFLGLLRADSAGIIEYSILEDISLL
jgi:hypothetical protein